MFAQDLPAEIVEQIIQVLPPQTVYECMSVSKLWSIFATSKYYETLTLDDKRLATLRSLFAHKQDPLILKQGHWVKELKIQENMLYSCVNPKKLLPAILPYLTSLKVLDITSSRDCQSYFKGLLLNKFKKEDMKHVQQIKFFCRANPFLDRDTMTDYIKTCYKFRKTITHLELYNVMSAYNINDHSGNYLDFLSLFKNLTHLFVDVDRMHRLNKGNDSSIMSSVPQVCPNLISLELKNSLSLLDQQQDELEETLFWQLGSVEEVERILSSPTEMSALAERGFHLKTLPPTPLPPPTSSLPLSMNIHLRSLVLTLPTLDLSQIEYITSYIPVSQLNIFELKLTREIFHEWIQCTDIQTIIKFAKHLSLVKNLDFYVSDFKKVSKRVTSGQLTEEEVSKRSRFWMFIDAIKGDRNLKQHMKFDILPKPIKKSFNFGLQIENNSIMRLGHVIAFEDFFIENKAGALSSNFFVPSYASTIKTLEIVTPEGNSSRLSNYVSRNCPQLDCLNIYSVNE